MKTKGGYVQGYNAQAVATEDQVVVAVEVTDEATGYHQLHPMIDAANQALAAAGTDTPIGQLLADAGYCSEDNLAALGAKDPDCFIATRNSYRNPKPRNGRWAATSRCDLGGSDGPQGDHEIGPGGVSQAPANDRAGIRSDQRRSRRAPVCAAARLPPTVNGSCWRPPTTC